MTADAPDRMTLTAFVDAIPLASIVHTTQHEIVAVNRLCIDVLGYAPNHMIGRPTKDFIPERDRAAARSRAVELERAFRDENPDRQKTSSESPVLQSLLHADGTTVSCWLHIGLSTISGEDMFVVCMDRVDSVRDRSVHWRERAEYDELTGLLRRGPFLDTVTEWFETDAAITVAFVDVDRLKAINDTFGHAAGDRVLEVTAHRLVEWAGPNCVVGRFAGDEFLVAIQNDYHDSDLRSLERTLRAALSDAPITWTGGLLSATASVGAARRSSADDAASLISRADMRMYATKPGGAAGTQ